MPDARHTPVQTLNIWLTMTRAEHVTHGTRDTGHHSTVRSRAHAILVITAYRGHWHTRYLSQWTAVTGTQYLSSQCTAATGTHNICHHSVLRSRAHTILVITVHCGLTHLGSHGNQQREATQSRDECTHNGHTCWRYQVCQRRRQCTFYA